MGRSKEIALELAAFLDSPQARGLAQPGAEGVRTIGERLIEAVYDDLGEKPRLLDGEGVRALLDVHLPARMGQRDPLAAHVPAVLDAWLDHLEASQVVTQSFEIRSAVADRIDAFVELVAAGRNVPASPARSAPLVHKADRVGRNDPCWCGSGAKFKKCHGKGA